MNINRFNEIAAELERLATEIAAINAQPFEYLVEISSEKSTKAKSEGMQAMVDNVERLNSSRNSNQGHNA